MVSPETESVSRSVRPVGGAKGRCAWGLLLRGDDLLAHRVAHQAGVVSEVELSHDAGAVRLYGPDSNT